MSESTLGFVRALPKVELHIHLVGAVPIETMGSLVTRAGSPQLSHLLRNLKEGPRYHDADHFGDVYQAVNRLFQTPEDFSSAVVAVARELAEQNVRYAEMAVTPGNHLRHGVRRRDLVSGLEAGRVAAELETGVRIRWCIAASGRGSVAEAQMALDLALDMQEGSVVSFGIGGPEVARQPFAPIFQRAKEAGLHIAPHAGERCGPEEVWSSIVDLGAERIGHGIRSIEDPELVTYLRNHQIPLEVCPSSNVMTGLVASMREHPIGDLMEMGLLITVNSDDPTLFATDLSSEYYLVANVLKLDHSAVANLARNSIRAAFLPEVDKVAMLHELDDFEDSRRDEWTS